MLRAPGVIDAAIQQASSDWSFNLPWNSATAEFSTTMSNGNLIHSGMPPLEELANALVSIALRGCRGGH
jgi:hypothetical protein